MCTQRKIALRLCHAMPIKVKIRLVVIGQVEIGLVEIKKKKTIVRPLQDILAHARDVLENPWKAAWLEKTF